ncbi:uncharacterized protein LOC117790485 [Drosophila innubila]|uniref:uncharacterized protein LOC117790485 n=1 Tax=Drosophila innubila TaxID=198719 RepID=UPI00148CDEA6|nr:uncharacterized protein LOC117790485 [Drosophila innubila]
MKFAWTHDPETVQQMLYIHRLIRNRIGNSATVSSMQPLWYRGLSDIQMAAADALPAALGDDQLEGSTYRVYHVLHRLGVHPRPPKSGLRRLIPMSRGNDVAFLWFLMEAYYTSEHDNLYGSNEQIIMSAIFWLDLFPTLRQLDRVLPLPHPSEETRRKEAQAEARRLKQAAREKLKMEHNRMQSHSKSEQFSYPILPYFERPPKRKFRRRNLLASATKRPAILPVVPPETSSSTLRSRWFGDFVFGDGQCIATNVLQREIDNILSSLHAAKLHPSQVESMCQHHKMIRDMEHSLRQNLEKIKQKQREQLLHSENRSKERNRRRTLDQLDRMVEHYQAKFHAMAIKTRMTSTRKQLSARASDPGFIYIGNADCDSLEDKSCDWSEEVRLLQGCEPLPPSCRDNTPKQPKLRCKCQVAVNKVNKSLRHRPSTLMQFLRMGGTGKIDRNASSSTSRRESNNYFDHNGNNFKFNYRRLFAPSKSTLLNNDQMQLRAQFVKALDDDVEYLNAVLQGDRRGSMESLVDRSAKRMFHDGTELFHQEYNKMAAEQTQKEPEQRLNFGQKYYDADNIELMKEMLKLGLERVAQDRRYILPSLPNVHSVPLLIKWICARYGKLYSLEERKRNFVEANVLMNRLMIILRKEIVRRHCRRPTLLPNKMISIQDQNNMNRLLIHYWDHFMKYFVLSIMELGRIFHSIMEADLGTNSTSIYYAYMPAHIRDIEFSRRTPFLDRRK